MRFRQHHNDLAETLSFGVVHIVLAIGIGWLLSGTFVFGALLALVEPLCNTVASHQIGKLVARRGGGKKQMLLKSVLIGMVHLIVAVGLARWLTGSFVTAWAYALIEPVANAVAHYFFQRWWHRGAVPEAMAPRGA